MTSSTATPIPILVAEDNTADVLMVRLALDSWGIHYHLHHVPDGEQAIQFILRADSDATAPCPALLLLDMNLPRKEGHEVLRVVRQSITCAAIPVIVFTSSDSPRDIERVIALGARYFRKPSDLNEFLSLGGIVQEVLQRH